MSEDEVVCTDVRGQCEKGHVLKAEVFGPELPESWMCSCPLPDCGFDITWQRRPEYLVPEAVPAPPCKCGHPFDDHTLYGPRDICRSCDCHRYVKAEA